MDYIDPASPSVKPELADSASNTRSWKYFFDKIDSIWRKGAGDFIACGRYLSEAKGELRDDAYSAMLKKLRIHPSLAKKLICIAKNSTLSSHVNQLPPCYSTLYELSQLEEDALKAALDAGDVHPSMERKDAIKLKPKKPKTPKTETEASNNKSEIAAVWKAASPGDRRHFLDQIGRDGLCAAMSATLQADLRDHVIGITIAGASKSASFAVYATDKLHTALRCAEQQKSDDESIQNMVGALRCITQTAERKGITRSDVVVAQGKPVKGRK